MSLYHTLLFMFLIIPSYCYKRIIGGAITSIEENPWQVSLQAFENHNCGGSIISTNVVLTAAHCFDGIVPLMYEVVAGTANLLEGGTRTSIKDVVVHEDYNGFSNDVAVIFLSEDLVFDGTTQAIPLTEIEPDDGDLVRVTGFGALSESDTTTTDLLYSVDVNIVNRDKCAAMYSSLDDATIESTMICAGVPSGGKDACSSDSGGPLSKNGTLVGIVSWGNGCGNAAYPGVYTNIASIQQWIKSNTAI